MITSKELIKVAELRGKHITYGGLKTAMRDADVVFKTKVVNGHPIEAYLTSEDVNNIGDVIGVRFNG